MKSACLFFFTLWIPLAATAAGGDLFSKDSVIELLADRSVTPVAFETARGRIENTAGEAVDMKATTALIIKDLATAANGAPIVRVQRDVEGFDPNDFWILGSALNPGDFRVAVPSLSHQLSITDPGEETSAADDIYVTLDSGRLQSRSVPSYCTLHPTVVFCSVAAVKYKIEKHGLVSHRVQGASSRQFVANLIGEGWHVTSCDAREKAKPGLICSHDDVYQGVGFVEIWTGKGWYSGRRYKRLRPESACSYLAPRARCVIKN
jgi:hypothetical protein